MKKILIITYYWPPSGGAGVQRWVKFVKYLTNFDIEPIVLTVDKQFASYPIIDQTLEDEVPERTMVCYTKSSEPFGAYQKLSGKKDIPYSGFANESKVSFSQKTMRFIRGNFFIPDARKGWNKYAFEKASQLITEHGIKTVITTSPPHSSQLIGLKLKKELNINWIADLRDPWTDIYYYDQLYHTSIAKKIDRNYERKVLVESDKVIVVSDAIKKQFLTKDAAIKSSKFSIIPNGFDESDFTDKPIRDENRFIITYTGTIAPNYNIESFLKAVLRLHEETNDDRILLRFVGVVADHFKNLIENTNLQQCTEFIGHVKHSRSIQYLNQSAILFLAIPDVQHNKGILTGKLFEYLGSRKPIVGVGPVDGDAARIISECRAGKMYNYHDQDKLFDYLMLLYNQWLQNKQLISSEKVISYSRKRLTEKLAYLIEN